MGVEFFRTKTLATAAVIDRLVRELDIIIESDLHEARKIVRAREVIYHIRHTAQTYLESIEENGEER